MSLHNTSTGTNNHALPAWTYATNSAREGATLVAADIGKMAYQSDTGQYWILQNNTGPIWVLLSHGYVIANFDATSGKAEATYGLDIYIPTNAIITKAFYEVLTTFTSATDASTLQIGVNTDDASGIVAATAISAGGSVWDSGNHDAIPTGAAANFTTKATARRQIELIVAGGEDLTDGELNLFIEYVVSA